MPDKRKIRDADLEGVSGGGEGQVFAPDDPSGGSGRPGATTQPGDPPVGGSPGVEGESDPGGIGEGDPGDLNKG